MIPISPDDFARNPSISDERHDLIANLISRVAYGDINEVPEVDIPIAECEARAFAKAQAGLGSCSRSGSLDICWIRLRLSKTAEQRLSYMRMITAIAVMYGMQDYKMGEIICTKNRERARAAEDKKREDEALSDWRSPLLPEEKPMRAASFPAVSRDAQCPDRSEGPVEL